ncbi:MAG TPA: hypothetical protein VFP80_00660 [Thermoanaerobaculia bacterium]|nr:hypothetical protein [Thermoanaerobaculia bacterium]
MAKVAEPEPLEKRGGDEKVGDDRTHARDTDKQTVAEKLVQSARGWAGDDLEEIIGIVSATRSRSRF